MNNIPEDMQQVQQMVEQAKANGKNTTAEEIIETGIRQWAQDYLDEATEGSYFTARVDGKKINVTDMNGKATASISTTAPSYVAAFKQDARGTMTTIANDLRHLIDNHQIEL